MEDALRGGWSRLGEWLDFEVRLGELSIGLGGLLGAAITLLLLWLLASFVKRALDRYALRREDARRAALYTVSRIAYYVLIVIAVSMALSVAGIPISRFAVFAGALGVGLGFGLQAIFNNFISGLILLFDRSLKVGDFVELESGVHGEVKDINIRATLIRTNDNIDILVPNSEFVSGRVTNWTHHDLSRRLRMPFGVAYGTDKELVKKAALEAAAEVPFTLTLEGVRGPKVWLVGFGDSSLDFELVVWLTAEATKRPATVRAAYYWALETALNKYCISIPFPQRDLHLVSAFGLQRADAVRAFGQQAPREALRELEQPGVPQLSENERAALARNDAQQEVEVEIARDQEEAAAEAVEAAGSGPARAARDEDDEARRDRDRDRNR